MSEPRLPPHSRQTEIAVLGSIFLENTVLDLILNVLDPGHFYFQQHGTIYRHMVQLHSQAKPVNLVSVAESIKSESNALLDQVGGPSYLAGLVDQVPSPKNAPHYASVVREKAQLRQLISTSHEIIENAFGEGEASVIIDQAENAIFQIGQGNDTRSVISLQTALSDLWVVIKERMANPNPLTGLSWGFSDMDNLTGGLHKSDLVILGARPGMGKTAFVLNLAANVIRQTPVNNYRPAVVIFSLEMSVQQLATRVFSAESRVEAKRLITGNLSAEDAMDLFNVARRLAEGKLYIDETPAISAAEMRAKSRRLKAEGKCDLVLIDYLQLMKGPPGTQSREQEIASISRSLKQLAKELDVPVVALAQVSRAVEKRDDKRPILSDLRESGSIEQDADLICFLFREEYYKKESKQEIHPDLIGKAELIVAKNRHGENGTVNLKWTDAYVRFDGLARERFPGEPTKSVAPTPAPLPVATQRELI